MPHVRVLDRPLADLFATVYVTSPTLQSLVDRLQRSDVIVHVESRRLKSANVGGMLQFVTQAAGYRYLRITIDIALSPERAAMLLGHELQHAVEVADEPSVKNGVSLEMLYLRIGHTCHTSVRPRRCDTAAARDVGQRVLAEVRKAGGRVCPAPPTSPVGRGGVGQASDDPAASCLRLSG